MFAESFKASRAKLGANAQKGPKKSKDKHKAEYWFLVESTAKTPAFDDVRVKFVNTDDYQVVRGKEGWVDVKENSKIKSRWVVLKEDTLLYYKEPTDPKPLATLTDVSSYEITTKKGEDTIPSRRQSAVYTGL